MVDKNKASKDDLHTNSNEGFTKTDDTDAFLQIMAATGVQFDFDTEEGRAHFTTEYNRWVKAGRYKPIMPKLEEEPIPMKLYRMRHMGNQKMFWRDTKGKMHGKEVIEKPVMVTMPDAQTKAPIQVVDHVEKITKYNEDYDQKKGEKLVEDALARCERPTFYFMNGQNKYSVKSSDFNGDFDAIIVVHRAGKYVL